MAMLPLSPVSGLKGLSGEIFISPGEVLIYSRRDRDYRPGLFLRKKENRFSYRFLENRDLTKMGSNKQHLQKEG